MESLAVNCGIEGRGAMYGNSCQIEANGLHPGDVYLFRLRTRFGDLRSEPSNELAFSVEGYLSNGFYSIQASLMGQSVSAARLEWTADGPAEEWTNYEVQMRNGTSGAWTTLGTVAADAFDDYVQVGETGCHVYSFQPIGLVPGRNYFFRVRLVRPSDDHFENPSPVATLLAPVDSDGDGIPDAQELVMGTNPNAADSDGDGYSDGEELAAGTNPNDAAGHPNYHESGGTVGGGGNPPPLPPPPADPAAVVPIPVVQYASINLTEITGVKATGGMAFGDDGKIAFYENAGSHYKVAVWSPDGSYKLGTVPSHDPQGAPLYVVGINSEGMLAGNSLGYNRQKNRTISVAFKAHPIWNSTGASIEYPFKNANGDCFVEVNVAPCGQPEDMREVALPSAVIGVSRMNGPWGTNTAFLDWKYECEACCGGYSEEVLAQGYHVWNQVFYGSGVVMPTATANIAQADTDMDGLDDAEVSSLQITYSPSPYLASLSDVSFNGASPYGEWRSGESFSASGVPSATSLGIGFAPNQNGLPSVEVNKTNDAPQGVNGANLVTSAVAEAQSKVPSELQEYVKITHVRDNGNDQALLADAQVWTVSTEGGEPHWVERTVRIKNSVIEIVGSGNARYIGVIAILAGVEAERAVALLPMEISPELLPVNRGFGEGKIDGGRALVNTVGGSLKAQRETVDGRYQAGDFVTEDLHDGWFGVSPSGIDPSFFDGASVTIRKVVKRDSADKVTEKGHVCFYATWEGGNEKQIMPYWIFDEITGEEHPPKELVGIVYGSNATVPRTAKLWIEGYYPGKITLEFRLKKGALEYKYEQTFEVACDWSQAKWKSVVRDHVFLLAKAARPTAVLDIDNYQVANEFINNRKYVEAVFNYYGALFREGESGNDTKYYWAGLAKTVGGPLYAALSDAQWGRTNIVDGVPIPFVADTCRQVQNCLMGGNIAVFQDLAYQHLAHETSGVRAMEFLEKRGHISIEILQKWVAIGEILELKPEGEVQTANEALLRYEQRVILQPSFNQLNTMTLAGLDVSFFLSLLSKAPNGTPAFFTVLPGGNLCSFEDRWQWVTDTERGMLPAWCRMARNDRRNLVAANLMPVAASFSKLTGLPLVYFLTPDALHP